MQKRRRCSRGLHGTSAAGFRNLRNAKGRMGKIKLFPTPEYTSKQASDPVVPLVPCTGIFLGPSKSGKTVALISLILEQHKGVFERIYVFSPSVNIDDGWIPVKKYIEQDLGVNTEREQAVSGLVWAQALPKDPSSLLEWRSG